MTIGQLISLQNNVPDDMIISGKDKNTKLMFHKIDTKKYDINPHFKIVAFEEFQKEHWNTFFANTKYILSFWYEGKTAEFIGAYKLGLPSIDKFFDENEKKERDRYRFPEMIKIDFLQDYTNRLFIKWTNPSANYGRWLDDEKYEIHSLKPQKEFSIGKLPANYFEIKLNYAELKKMVDFEVDNQEWYNYLSNRAGVYIILDKSDGMQYIGSAYGENGFWGRWSDYATTGNGGNVELKNRDANNFQFSILWETLNSIDKEKIIEVESKFKNNLGTRVHGLNNN